MMNNFFEDLRKYFESTPRKQVLEDWEKSQEFNKVGPTVDEFLKNNKKCFLYDNKFIVEEDIEIFDKTYKIKK